MQICEYNYPQHEWVNLQDMGMAGMLEEIINYVHSLQNQVEVSHIHNQSLEVFIPKVIIPTVLT